jgi:hypothetical protein
MAACGSTLAGNVLYKATELKKYVKEYKKQTRLK